MDRAIEPDLLLCAARDTSHGLLSHLVGRAARCGIIPRSRALFGGRRWLGLDLSQRPGHCDPAIQQRSTRKGERGRAAARPPPSC